MSDTAYFGLPEKRTLSELWEDAACRGTDPDVWFDPGLGSGRREGKHEARRRIALAKSICHTCPLVAECIADGAQIGDKWSIRGGLTAGERIMRGLVGGVR